MTPPPLAAVDGLLRGGRQTYRPGMPGSVRIISSRPRLSVNLSPPAREQKQASSANQPAPGRWLTANPFLQKRGGGTVRRQASGQERYAQKKMQHRPAHCPQYAALRLALTAPKQIADGRTELVGKDKRHRRPARHGGQHRVVRSRSNGGSMLLAVRVVDIAAGTSSPTMSIVDPTSRG
ncbi:hypothetical protein MAPG_09062 [Magnaporthiopsis poae ATCC 64411]|uniref:Uncharacterized protein n=1 Tax=Magnaporthiopsis poae (strain ATCC 64411 / 73-15) TaxID=644358 RepID=A0A0C4E8Z0_MAGP6|nr:hypothetical protein MAPG_09062 [Magnaporthiopsis poae ATCC 64411]